MLGDVVECLLSNAVQGDLDVGRQGTVAQDSRRDGYARPDAEALGRLLSGAAKRMPEEVPIERLATRVRERLPPVLLGRDRAAYLGRHLAAGAFSLSSLLYLLPRVPFYPEVAVFPLVIVPAFVALMWPFTR